REYFRFLEGIGIITKSPTTGIETPKRERNGRQVLRSDEYTKMLSLAGANPRDYAILQVFLQTGIRVSELANLTKDDIDFVKPSIIVRGKGCMSVRFSLRKKASTPSKAIWRLGVRVSQEKSFSIIRGNRSQSGGYVNSWSSIAKRRGLPRKHP